MNLLLLNTPTFDPLRTACEAPALGIAYLAACVREHGHQVRLLDGDPQHTGTESPADLFELVSAQPFDILGISCSTIAFLKSIDLISLVKDANPTCFVVYGGQHASATHRELLSTYPDIDAVVRGEGEQTLCELADRLAAGGDLEGVLGLSYRNRDRVVVNPSRPVLSDLDRLPFPARDLFRPLDAYLPFFDLERGRPLRIGTIISSRGCPYSCSFCSIQSFYTAAGKKWRARRPATVADEIEELIDRHGVEFISFVDDNFFIQPRRALAIFEELERRGKRVAFAFATRTDQIIKGRDFIPALRQAGCRRIELGLEHGSASALQRLNKGVEVGDNAAALKIVRENDILVKCDWIMFDPDTTLRELEEGMEFVKQHGLDSLFPPLVYTCMDLLPGTDAFRAMVESGRAQPDFTQQPEWEFADRRVAGIFSLVQRFLREYQIDISSVVNQIEESYLATRARMSEIPSGSREHGHLQSVTTEYTLLAIVLKRKPYRVFEGLLAAAREHRPLAERYEELTRDGRGQLESCRQRLADLAVD